MLRPISTVAPWQRIKVRQQDETYKSGYVVVAHGKGLIQGLTSVVMRDAFGSTVIACQVWRRGKEETAFYQVPSTSMVELDE